MSETAAKGRRIVQYSSMSAFRADVEKLVAGKYETVGEWSFGQIVQHLAININGSFDGFSFRAPWFMRFLIAPFMKKSLLTQPMKPGFKLPKSAAAALPAAEVTTGEGLDLLLAALDRFEKEAPEAKSPFLGTLTPKEWVALHLKHAELHMSFVRPA